MTMRVALKIAVSTLALSTLGGCGPAATERGVTSASASGTVKAARNAAAAAALAEKALAANDHAKAIVAAEAAVAGSPRDAAYRMLLGQAYLAGGRFLSAETAFTDTLTLDPANGRASLSLALARIALGQPGMAVMTLADAKGAIGDTDRGLALTLAGEHNAAIALLEPAARAEGASAKTRQNLALAYALSGKWTEARAVAAQDVAPDLLDRTLAGWAGFAQPQRSWDQVAALLGVKPALDRGQPVRLALAPLPAAAPVQTAAVEMVVDAPVQTAAGALVVDTPVEAAPVEVAAAAPMTVETAPAASPVAGVSFAARREIVQPLPATPLRASAELIKRSVTVAKARPAAVADGRYVVQLGAHDNAKMAEWAWGRAVARHKVLAGYAPTGETLGKFHRVAAGGFASHGDAAKVCAEVRQGGGSCFVRAATSQRPQGWALRFATKYAAR